MGDFDLSGVRAAVPDAARLALAAGLEVIVGHGEDLAPKRTFKLASTIRPFGPEEDGTLFVGSVVAGDADTVTPWKGLGIGYEVFQELGTIHIHAVHYLYNATVGSVGEIASVMAERFHDSLTRAGMGGSD